jgi:hypothetical protein
MFEEAKDRLTVFWRCSGEWALRVESERKGVVGGDPSVARVACAA